MKLINKSVIDSMIQITPEHGAVSLLYFKTFFYCLAFEYYDETTQNFKLTIVMPKASKLWDKRHSNKDIATFTVTPERERLKILLKSMGLQLSISSTWKIDISKLTKLQTNLKKNNVVKLVSLYNTLFAKEKFTTPEGYSWCSSHLKLINIDSYRLDI